MDEYGTAKNSADSHAARKKVENFGALFTVCSSVGGVSISLGSLLWLLKPGEEGARHRIEEIDREIRTMELE